MLSPATPSITPAIPPARDAVGKDEIFYNYGSVFSNSKTTKLPLLSALASAHCTCDIIVSPQCCPNSKTFNVQKSENMKRPRRKAKERAAHPPAGISPSWYVGYAEDHESVETIMRKFEELEKIKDRKSMSTELALQDSPYDDSERIMKTSGMSTSYQVNDQDHGDQGALSQMDLEELFKKTSSFHLSSVVTNMHGVNFSSDDLLWILDEGGDSDSDSE
ncbi:hypothetical protein HDU67_004477 [Dinochytrium kinnereticum]|nr:hypothetical protein HDU67_004477 [Dinochytrium kinnereticum]